MVRCLQVGTNTYFAVIYEDGLVNIYNMVILFKKNINRLVFKRYENGYKEGKRF